MNCGSAYLLDANGESADSRARQIGEFEAILIRALALEKYGKFPFRG